MFTQVLVELWETLSIIITFSNSVPSEKEGPIVCKTFVSNGHSYYLHAEKVKQALLSYVKPKNAEQD